MQLKGIKIWLLSALFFLLASCKGAGPKERDVRFVVIDSETKSPISGADVYFTDFNYKTIFDWDMETEKIGYTSETGEVYAVLKSRNDSVRVEKEGYLSFSIVMASEDEVILVYRESGSKQVIARKLLKITELDEVIAFKESSVPILK